MIIDFHTHALTPAIKQNRRRYLEKDTAFASIYSGDKAKIATIDDLITAMDRDGVDFSVVVNYSWTTHALCMETNNGILEGIARYPKRLAGFCAVSSLNDDASLKEIERCAKAGAKGIGELRIDQQLLDYTEEDTIKPFAEIARRYNLMVMAHSSEQVGHIYAGKGTATPGMLYAFISQLTEIPVICAHWGGGLPFYTLMPEVRDALENVYYDTAASPFLYRPEIYNIAATLAGADRILFGSDFPVMSPSRILDEIKNSELSKEDKEEILANNARRLLGI
jgi:predicted TIM-barrel fold metal-dependent hydrolase